MKKLLLLLSFYWGLIGSGLVVYAEPLTSPSQFENSKCYTVRTPRAGAWYYSSSDNCLRSTISYDKDGNKDSANSIAEDSSDPYQQWAFLSINGKMYAYNVGCKKFLVSDGTMSDMPCDAIYFESSTNKDSNVDLPSHPLIAYFDATRYIGLNSDGNVIIIRSSQQYNLYSSCFYLAIEEVSSFDNTEAIEALKYFPTTIEMTYGNGTLSGKTWTSNATSGVAGLTITSSGYSMSANGTSSTSYYYMTPDYGSSTFNYTITAPEGWQLAGYSITFINKHYSGAYGKTGPDVSTASGGYTVSSRGAEATMSLTDQASSSLQFSFKNGSSGARVVVTAFTITLRPLEPYNIEPAEVAWSSGSGILYANGIKELPTLKNPNGLIVSYSSSEPSVATVDANTGVIRPIYWGATRIRATWAEQDIDDKKYLHGYTDYLLTVSALSPTINPSSNHVLTIKQAENGSVGVEVPHGNTQTCTITANDGWRIHSVSFNDEDVTSQLNDKMEFITPAITENSTLCVVYEEDVPSAMPSLRNSTMKIKGTSYGARVTDASLGDIIQIYSKDGILQNSVNVNSEIMDIPLAKGEVYIIKVGDKTLKLKH